MSWSSEGKQIRKNIGYFKTKQEAIDALALNRVSPISPKADLTLGDLYKEWSAMKYPRITKSTADNYRSAWSFLQPLKNSKFKDLRTAHFQQIVDGLEKSHSTLRKIKTLLSLLYGYAAQNDIVQKNYAEFIILPKQTKKKKDIFTDLEIAQLFKVVDFVPFVDTVLIMIYTGLRISELLALTPFNVDLKRGFITVEESKTEAGAGRVIPVHPKIRPLIEARYQEGRQRLITDDNGKPFTPDSYRKYRYYPLLEKLELRRLPPHTCRHTFATKLAQAGADPLYIQQVMGHTDYSFTANVYSHPEYEQLKQAVHSL